jgi:hypothetical protein
MKRRICFQSGKNHIMFGLSQSTLRSEGLPTYSNMQHRTRDGYKDGDIRISHKQSNRDDGMALDVIWMEMGVGRRIGGIGSLE